MARVKRAVNAAKKRRTILERAEGYRGQRSRLYRKAKEQVTHSLVYSYRDRRAKKGEFRLVALAVAVGQFAHKMREVTPLRPRLTQIQADRARRPAQLARQGIHLFPRKSQG